MTLAELSRNYKLQECIRQDQEILASLRAKASPGAQRLDGMPRGSAGGDRVGTLAIEITDLETEIQSLQAQSQAQRQTISDYIQTIQDAKTRTIFRLRFIHCMTWAEVAALVGPYYTEDGVRRLVYKYLEKHLDH